MPQTTRPNEEGGALHLLPLGLAFVGGVVQLVSCGTRIVKVGIPVGVAVSVAAIVLGHVVLWRRWHSDREGRWLAWFSLVAAYISLLIIRIVGYGILLVVLRGDH